MTGRCIDLLYTAFNRLDFTKASFATLVENTDWELIRELVVNDDGSTDGTREWLVDNLTRVPVPSRLAVSTFGSPIAVFSDFIARAKAPFIAKTDNDVLLPPHWLRESLAVLLAHPELTFLGIEAIQTHALTHAGPRSFASARWISGLGLYRREAFAKSLPQPLHRWFGFEQWLDRQNPPLVVGWMAPGMPLVLLDRVPFEPWRSMTEAYVANGWQRRWHEYEPNSTLWNWYWPERKLAAEPEPLFSVVILSANAHNTVASVQSILRNEPSLDPQRIFIVDDGARALAEERLPGIRWVEGAKPFVFARNANRGISAAGSSDVILMNDDAQLLTPGGFTRLARLIRTRPDVGLASVSIRGVVGNPRQKTRDGGALRLENADTLCFICTYIPRGVIQLAGPLDERFTGYGFEDRDYSVRVRARGLHLAVFDGCIVDHSGKLPSTFRTRRDFPLLARHNQQLFHEKQRQAKGGGPAMLAVMRVKNEAEHIGESLESVLPLCERAIVFDDHSDDETVATCESFGQRVEVLHSPFRGIDEARDKNYILERVVAAAPDWVLWIDGDEVIERDGPARLLEATARAGGITVYTLRVAYCWDGDDQIRVDGIWGRMRRPSLFRLRGQLVRNLHFAMSRPPNLHCGNVPRNLRGQKRDLDVRLKHYGYVTPELRLRKYQWYTRIDPHNPKEDNYRHLMSIPGARHAPGTPVFKAWDA
jgi:glycosyltransferase involved in cell wall biosynthesis